MDMDGANMEATGAELNTKQKKIKRRDVDMTSGNILSHIIRFSIPLLRGYIGQQL